MIRMKAKIPQYDFMTLYNSSRKELYEYVEKIADKTLYQSNIYGVYNVRLCEEEGKYWVEWDRYDSAD